MLGVAGTVTRLTDSENAERGDSGSVITRKMPGNNAARTHEPGHDWCVMRRRTLIAAHQSAINAPGRAPLRRSPRLLVIQPASLCPPLRYADLPIFSGCVIVSMLLPRPGLT